MSFANKFVQIAKRILPSPFTIAVLLTGFTFLLALFLTESKADSNLPHALQIMEHWEKGFWELLTFAMQMMLMLVLGHVLALSKAMNQLINASIRFCKDTASAAFFVTLLTICVSLINWGLGLIFGAIFVRKVGEYALKNDIPLNYPLIGAAGYSGLMVWHGGLSGSAPLKAAEKDNFLAADIAHVFPDGIIPMSETVFSSMNIIATVLLLIVLPTAMYYLGKRTSPQKYDLKLQTEDNETEKQQLVGAERLDNSRLLAYIFGGSMLFLGIYKAYTVVQSGGGISFINPNFINFMLFGIGIILHRHIANFLKAVNEAIAGSSGIMIQFPLYAGIMGIMKYSGLIDVFAGFFVQISNEFTFPLFTLISAGVVNVFVPSGGGQWAVQGPIIIDAAQQIGVALPKCVMALTYGDQLTNMMQPFWALPLLGITGLKAKEILPYSLFLMLLGFIIFSVMLMVF